MNKNVCFILDNKELLLDKVLISFNDTPIFFICRNGKSYYVVLCSNLENLEYIIVEQTVSNIWKMLTQKISMKELIISCSTFWKVIAGDTFMEDSVELISMEKIDESVLPIENAMFETLCDEDDKYVEQITSEYLNQINFNSFNIICDFDDMYNNCFGSFFENAKSIELYNDFIINTQDIEKGFKKVFVECMSYPETIFSYKHEMQLQEEKIEKNFAPGNSDYNELNMLAA